MSKPEMDPLESALIKLEDAEELIDSARTKVVLALARVLPADGSRLHLPGDLTHALWTLYQLSPQRGNEEFSDFLLTLLPRRSRAVVTLDAYWDTDRAGDPLSPHCKPSDILIIPTPTRTTKP